MSDAPESSAEAGELRALLARLRDVVEAKDTEIAVLREQCRLLELKVAELERGLGQDSTTSGMAPSKDPIGARERRKAERAREKKERQVSERERSEDRKRGGQPGHPGAGLWRNSDPAERKEVPPAAECSRCGASLEGADRTGAWWSQVWDVKITGSSLSTCCRCCLPVLREGGRRPAPGRGVPGQHLLRGAHLVFDDGVLAVQHVGELGVVAAEHAGYPAGRRDVRHDDGVPPARSGTRGNPREARQLRERLDITGIFQQAVHHGLRYDHGFFGEYT